MPLSSSITAEKNSPLERYRGRVHLIGGDFYYSPNSQRDVQLPLAYNDIPFRNCLPLPRLRTSSTKFCWCTFPGTFYISYFPRLRYGGFSTLYDLYFLLVILLWLVPLGVHSFQVADTCTLHGPARRTLSVA